MKHDTHCEWDPESRRPECHCATRAYERDPLLEAPSATKDFPPPRPSLFGAPRRAAS